MSEELNTTVYYLGLLLRGPKWTPDESAEVLGLQEDHMAFIRALGASGELVLAGPFLDDGAIRGIYLLKAESLEDARQIAQMDPSVRAGRLLVDIHPWMVPEGVLP
ncbi:MAG: YciI family protein [Anaerolineaceae bacterium]|nr:YciI family protein [Anaerolineaceae bacterium]